MSTRTINGAPRCPICGGEPTRDDLRNRWLCRCAGPMLELFWPVARAGQYDLDFEPFRRRRVEEGFGWSWFYPPPLIDRREEFGDR